MLWFQITLIELKIIISQKKKIIYGNLIEKLRYGENPHQQAAIYSKTKNLDIKQIHGKQLSYNNYNDIFSALTILIKLKKTIFPKKKLFMEI